MSSDVMAIQTAEGIADRPWVQTLHEWVTTVDHKRLGILYLLYALIFLVIGGIEATIIRVQLMHAHNDFVSPQVFNRMFTMHGTTMIFFVAMPLVFGFANYLVPLMIGARDMAFPRLNAFGFWLTALGGFLLYFSFLGGSGLYRAGNAPDVGWFAYAPLTSRAFSPGHSTDYWTIALLVSGFGSISTAINIITTVLCMRCPGMTLSRMPLLAWLNLVMAGLVILAFAFASEIIPVFSRKPIFGYPVMVAATICIAFIGMSVWAHHMFTIGMDSNANTFFVLTTMAIAVPTGIKIFNWLGTMWGGKIQFKTPMLFCVAFLFQFLIAGLTGIMLGAAPFDWQLSGSYFVVAHFHYVIVGGILFCVFGAIYYWYPKITGRMLNESLGKLHFWLFVIGFHLTFDAMHIPGVLGMPRRIYTYEPGRGWDTWNVIIIIGAFIQGIAMLVFLANLILSYFKGPRAGNDPWDAWTLEWSMSSPPPAYNFASIPTVASRRPLWDLKHPEDPDSHYE